jgi:uncharacterized membrane protein
VSASREAGDDPAARRGLRRAGIWLGMSLAGFFDGIVMHQVLQWHHMLTAVDDPAISGDLTLNTTVDGLFHVATYLFAIVGLVLLWRARQAFGAQRRGKYFVGAMLIGAGSFNLMEGVVDHHLLGIHHVRQTVPREEWIWWDLGFLVLAVLLLLAGWWLVRSGARAASLPA